MGVVPGVYDLFESLQAFDRRLGVLRTIPEIRGGHFLINIRNLTLLGLKVKDTPLSLGAFP